jgi:CBS domain containing-hemolysin-like protein
LSKDKDLFDQYAGGRGIDIEQAMHAPLIVPETTSILRTLDLLFRNTPVQVKEMARRSVKTAKSQEDST